MQTSMEFNTKNKKKSLFAFISLVFLFLLSFNGASIFSVKIPALSSSSTAHSPEKPARNSRNLITTPKQEIPPTTTIPISIPHLKLQTKPVENQEKPVSGTGAQANFVSIPFFRYAGKNPPADSNTHLPQFQESQINSVESEEKPVAGGEAPTKFASKPYFTHTGNKIPENSNTHLPQFQKFQTNSAESEEKPVAGAGSPTKFPPKPYFTYAGNKIPANSNTHLPHSRKSHSYSLDSEENLNLDSPIRNKKFMKTLTSLSNSPMKNFPARVKEHFSKKNDTVSCKIRFFMTWISPLKSFNERAFHSIESIFKTHPNGCLLIVSNSLDSIKGKQILKPFSDNGFRITAISPDFTYLFKHTMAESWFSRLIQGHVLPGDIPLGQNISNLLRLCLLYKYGGVYLDTDVIVLRSFSKLKNTIGAQTLDQNSKNWSRLNNAVMVFDKMHPLLYKFIEEFALTFNGNKWGHNGPYMVSRVVSRLQGKPGYNFTVLPPMAFYPVNWDRVRVLFRGPKNESDSRYLRGKFEQIRNQSYTVHLWNKQSRVFHIEDGSILRRILLDECIFCGSSSNEYIANTIG